MQTPGRPNRPAEPRGGPWGPRPCESHPAEGPEAASGRRGATFDSLRLPPAAKARQGLDIPQGLVTPALGSGESVGVEKAQVSGGTLGVLERFGGAFLVCGLTACTLTSFTRLCAKRLHLLESSKGQRSPLFTSYHQYPLTQQMIIEFHQLRLASSLRAVAKVASSSGRASNNKCPSDRSGGSNTHLFVFTAAGKTQQNIQLVPNKTLRKQRKGRYFCPR